MPGTRPRLAALTLVTASTFALILAGPSLGLLQIARTETLRDGLVEHVEARLKRENAESADLHRLAAGASAPPSIEGRDRGFDVLSYDLSFRVNPALRFLTGTAVLRLTGIAPSTSTVILDLHDAYQITGLLHDGISIAPASHAAGKLTLALDPPLRHEERTTLSISYRGVPPDGGSLNFWAHATGLAATSLSEPFGARTLFPCVDDPADRARTTVRATVPPGYQAASSGLSTIVTEPDGWRTFHWELPEPIPTYLVSLNVARYVELVDSYTAEDGMVLPIQSFVLPENRVLGQAHVNTFKTHLAVLTSLFGPYPFASTKYGIVESSFSGGMEHPTMTSIGTNLLGNPARDLTLLFVHELAHHWWGDQVTMRTWDDLWLNEGFATYSEVLYREKTLGINPGTMLRTSYDDGRYSGALARQVVASAANPFESSAATYQKGGWALHMLRRVVGDEAFFSGLRAYRDGFSFGNASRGDLRHVFEDRTGLDLKPFFDQWIETPYRPILRAIYRSSPDFGSVLVTVSQTQTHAVFHPEPAKGDVRWYRFPLTLRVTYADGSSSESTVQVEQVQETFSVPNPGRDAILSLTLDPRNDLLKVVEAVGPS